VRRCILSWRAVSETLRSQEFVDAGWILLQRTRSADIGFRPPAAGPKWRPINAAVISSASTVWPDKVESPELNRRERLWRSPRYPVKMIARAAGRAAFNARITLKAAAVAEP